MKGQIDLIACEDNGGAKMVKTDRAIQKEEYAAKPHITRSFM